MQIPAKAARCLIAATTAAVALLVAAAPPAAAGECTEVTSGVRVGGCGDDSPAPGGGSPEGSTPPSTAPAPPPAGRDAEGAARLLELVNDERRQAGLSALAVRPEIEDVAWRHSAAMAEKGQIWHNDAYFTAESRRRLGARALGENVARNSTVEDAHARLMASPGHRANILDARFNQVGVAVVRDGAGSLFVTEDFAAVPAPDSGASDAAAPGLPDAGAAPPPDGAEPAPAPAATRVASAGPTELSAGRPAGRPAEAATAATDLVRPAAVPRALVTVAAAPEPSTGDAVLAAGVCVLCALGLLDRRRTVLANAWRTALSNSMWTLPSRSPLT